MQHAEHIGKSKFSGTAAPLLQPIRVGGMQLKNRVVMAPLTRRRATADHIPTPIMIPYYEQRASAGLIVAEATNISLQAVGYPRSPGIFTRSQIDAWQEVTAAVHRRDGLIFLQLWHVGRVSHPLIQADGAIPVSASAIAAAGKITTPAGPRDMAVPRALKTEEVPGVVDDYRQASINAMEAGFDGVEIHGANGYLPDQFLHSGSNKRTDRYGGSIENRCRFLLEIVDACTRAIGADNVGIRLSPSGIVKDMYDDHPIELYEYLIRELNPFKLAYLHLMEPYAALEPEEMYRHYLKVVTPHFRKFFQGPVITNVDFTFESGNRILQDGFADLVAFGKPFISNPDLVERFAAGAPLAGWDKETFYHGEAKGYTDYPMMDGTVSEEV